MVNIYFKALLLVRGLFYSGSIPDEEADCWLLLGWQQSRGDLADLDLFLIFTKSWVLNVFFYECMIEVVQKYTET